jgi:hypothetical protein
VHYKAPNLDTKAEADLCFRDAGVPTTFVLNSFYWENLIHFRMGPKPGPERTTPWTQPLGMAGFPGIGVEDFGRCTHGAFMRDTTLTVRCGTGPRASSRCAAAR